MILTTGHKPSRSKTGAQSTMVTADGAVLRQAIDPTHRSWQLPAEIHQNPVAERPFKVKSRHSGFVTLHEPTAILVRGGNHPMT